ncbi:MAG: hypothetical protein Q8M93_24190 [Polaromonas sp.]|uniref:hypothetical protein n=1 Tax=Polaromonas sp. TaxID=1869339 RepID=UPI002731B7C7|nr:hypothetical protein [Polaromonas sp.]MDP2449630.1 hypothetical protein [Polaromonas sp.]MDP3250051.1 hypothetical protein [Polaromonas sp.]MDP3754039.1 hypothetical protein [Polaromonas sp.]
MLLQLDREEAIARSAGHSLEALKWSAGAAPWFESLRSVALSLGDDVIELPRGRSVVYHSSQWFMEILPRARGCTVRLAAEPEDLSDIAANVQDATAWLFVLNSTVNGGSLFTVNSQAECDLAIQLVRRTYEIVRL